MNNPNGNMPNNGNAPKATNATNAQKKANAPKKNDLPKKSAFSKLEDRFAAFTRRPWLRILKIAVATILVVMLIFFSAGWIFKDQTSFTIGIDDGKESKVISLSESEDFSAPTTRLDAGGLGEVTCISIKDLPETVESDGGSHNGENYLAYTFYLKNSGTETINVRSDMNIDKVTRNVDEAVRVRLYKNGLDTTYAKAKPAEGADGEIELEYNTVPFTSEDKVFSRLEENLKPDEIIKYTIVVWLHGDDLECVDDIKGGKLEMSLTFSVDNAET